MELRHVHALLAIAAERSFSGAADRLHVAQSGLSQLVKALEEELGVTLFVRERNGVQVTEAGERAVALARRLMEDLQEFSDLREEAPNGQRLRVGCIPGILGSWLPDTLARLRTWRPDVVVRAIEAQTAQIVSLLATGHIEAGIASTPCPRTGLVTVPLFEEGMVVLVRADSRWARRSTLRLRQIATEPMVAYPPGHVIREMLDANLARYGLKPTLTLEAQGSRIICRAVRDGFGVAMVSESFARHHAGPNLAYVSLRERRLRRQVILVYRQGYDDLAGTLEAFLSCVRGALSQPGTVPGQVLQR